MQSGEPNIPEKLTKPYNPSETEDRIYARWEESGFFNPDNLPERHAEPYSVIMPPPNANGSLHAGHAMMITIEDLLTRYKRMRGFKTLWLPGADHAGFETQVVYEKKLEKEGRSRMKMSREELYKEIMDFTMQNKTEMENQVRKLGASCDWSREKFTLDDDVIETVYNTFKQLNDDGLIYRGERIVNWCVKHQTNLSQLETESEEQTDPLYYIKYGPFTLATVRPETKFGDTALAVNPNDERYKEYVGKEIEIDTLLGKTNIKVVADEYVDPEFGTGVVKITPAHDPNDFEVGRRHNLEVKEVIDRYGKLNEHCGKYAGLKIKEARKVVAEDLEKAGLLEKVDHDYKHAVIKCYKCGSILEPKVSKQWFVKTKPLAERALEAVESGKTNFVTPQFEKIFRHWMSNIQDWNISRQIAWGIPIPAKICEECGDGHVDLDDKIDKCPSCGGGVVADPDTFDTWFSSGQWPYATLGYPNGRDFEEYYPTAVMETGADILFFWVARMMMLGIYRTGEVPFRTIYLHGMVRDGKGQKMSKSKGNVINPIDITEKYGTDALRMALIVGNTPGTDLALAENKIKGYKHFSNKIWNVARFVLSNISTAYPQTGEPNVNERDQKHLDRLKGIADDITADLNNFRFHLAAEKLYGYFWHELADVIIEESKPILAGDDEAAKASRQHTLYTILETCLKMLHPFMPFITEEIWSMLAGESEKLLMVEEWPR